jgi:glycosyltransferase involved in cell wall biosynthesis
MSLATDARLASELPGMEAEELGMQLFENQVGSVPEAPAARVDPGAIVIPCFNHGEHLYGVIASIRGVLPTIPIAVVDDGSIPPIPEIPGVTILRHSSNCGKGAAIETGLRHFAGSEYLILIDSDGQHSPRAIPALIEALDGRPRADLVIATRDFFHDDSIPMRHRLANIALAMEFALLHHRYFRDVTNGLRVVRTKSLLIDGVRLRRYEVEIETLRSMLYEGRVIREVRDFSTHYDTPSTLGRGFRITVMLGLSMFRARFSVARSHPDRIQPRWS